MIAYPNCVAKLEPVMWMLPCQKNKKWPNQVWGCYSLRLILFDKRNTEISAQLSKKKPLEDRTLEYRNTRILAEQEI